jgi:predicted phage-related endonuclease
MGSIPKGISASRGASILGLSEYQTPVETWLKIMDDRDPEFCQRNGYEKPVREYTKIMAMGHAFENAVIGIASDLQNDAIGQREEFYQLKPEDYITCHIDGMYSSKKCLHEGKTTNIITFREKWGEPGSDRIPVDYQCQVQHQMLCTGAEMAIVSVLVFPMRQDDMPDPPAECLAEKWADTFADIGLFHQYYVRRDEYMIGTMRKIYADFWEHNVLGENPPEPQKYDDVRKIFKAPKGKIVASKQMQEWAAEYKGITGEEKQIKARKDEIKKLLVNGSRVEGLENGFDIDKESAEKLILLNDRGFKIASFNGKTFRASGK